jgi:hypothetical protein
MRNVNGVIRSAFLILAFVACAPCFGQPQRSGGRGEDPSMQLTRMINVGDPAGVPIVMKGLDQLLTKDYSLETHNMTFAVLRGVKEYRLEDAGPTLAAIYQNPRTPREVRDVIADAAAAIHTPAARRFLKVILQDPELRSRSRIQVLGAMVWLKDDAARKELFQDYSKALLTRPNQDLDVSFAPSVVAELEDEALIAQIKKLSETTRDMDARESAAAMVQRMELNRMPVADLLKIAEDDWQKGAARRIGALDALSVKAGLDAVPRLLNLRPFANFPNANAASETSDQRSLEFARQRAVKRIRRLRWREQKGPPPDDLPAISEPRAK